MDKHYTSRLFHKKYAYKIELCRKDKLNHADYHKGWTVQNSKKWLNDRKTDYKIYSSVRMKENTVKASIFLSDRKIFDDFVTNWRSYVISVTEPSDPSHIEILKDNKSIIIKDKLYYNRFRYGVVFDQLSLDQSAEIMTWINSTLLIRENANATVRCSFKDRIYFGDKVYLSEKDDCTLIRLTFGEYIKRINVIRLRDELSS